MNHCPEYDLDTIGRNLRICRHFYGYSAEDIKNYLHLGSVQSVYQYEKGIAVPRADSMLALMELYQLKPFDLRNKNFKKA